MIKAVFIDIDFRYFRKNFKNFLIESRKCDTIYI